MYLPRLLSEESDDYTACVHACEECEARHCRNQWLEIPEGRRLTVAEYIYSQNICIVIVVVLVTIFNFLYRKLKEVADMHELVHIEELAYDADAPYIPDRWDLMHRVTYHKETENPTDAMTETEEQVSLSADELTKLKTNAVLAHESLHRAFAFYTTVKQLERAGDIAAGLTPGHGTILKVINKIPERHYYQALMQSIAGELMGLGWIAIFVWGAEHTGLFKAAAVGRNGRWGPQRPDEAKLAFENVHFAVFAGVVLYFCFVFWTLRSSTRRIDCIMKQELELAQARANKKEYDTPKMKTTMFGKMNLDRSLFPGYRQALINWIDENMSKFEEYGVLSPKFSPTLFCAIKDEFPVALYLRLSLDNIVEEFVDVRLSSWAVVLTVFGIEAFIARVVEVDIPIVTLGSATLFNATIVIMLMFCRTEVNKFTNGTGQRHPASPKVQWIHRQLPHFVQAATLYITLQFARFCVDSIVDITLQERHYRGRQSYHFWLLVQVFNLCFHFLLHTHIFPRLCILIASPPVVSRESVDLLAEITILYASITRDISLSSNRNHHLYHQHTL